MFSKKSRITFIGAGKAAYSLADAIKKANYNITSVFSKNLNSAKNFSQKFSAGLYSNKISDLPEESKIIFLSVPDNQIKILADEISNLNLNFEQKLFIHLSGANDTSILSSLKRKKRKLLRFILCRRSLQKR